MKISLNKIVSHVEELKSLQEIKFPVKVSYRIKRLVDKLDPILKAYNEKRNEMIKELGEEDPETKNFSVKDPEKLKEFSKKLQELLTTEEEVDFEKISVDSLGEISVEPSKLLDFVFE